MKNNILGKSISLVLSVALLAGCGIDIKPPKDLKLDVNVGLDQVAAKIDRYLRKRLPSDWYRFLKDPELKKHIQEKGQGLNAECLIPSRNMLTGEQQGDKYLFLLKQYCYAFDQNTQKVLRHEIYIEAELDTKTLKYQLYLDTDYEPSSQYVTFEEYQKHVNRNRFLKDPTQADPTAAAAPIAESPSE